jgi:4-O-beta-D-mannosyl-D-glucose phosphorylase
VVFCNGAVLRADGTVLIYYALRHAAACGAKRLGRLLDYVKNTPSDPLRTGLCVEQRIDLIERNREYLKRSGNGELLKRLF